MFSGLPPKADHLPILELLPPPALRERRHRVFARREIEQRGHACRLDWPIGSPLRASRVLFVKAAFQIVEREVLVDQEVF